MSFKIIYNQDNVNFESLPANLLHNEGVRWEIYSGNFSEEELETVKISLSKDSLDEFLANMNKSHFFLIIWDRQEKKLRVYNDLMSSNTIMWAQSDSTVYLSDDVFWIYEKLGADPVVSVPAVHEFLSFYTIVPPATIYENIFMVPLGSYLSVNGDDAGAPKAELIEFFDWRRRLNPKNNSYSGYVQDVRNGMKEALLSDLLEKDSIGIALSSGVDSSGLLAMTRDIFPEKPITAITMAPYGKEYGEFLFAEETAKKYQAEQKVVIPEAKDLANLADYSSGLPQPIEASVLLSYGLILDQAASNSVSKLIMGHGAEMILGNLKIARALYAIRYIELLPRFMSRPIYRLLAKIKGFSKNQTNFLLAGNLLDRFFIARGPIVHNICPYFRDFDESIYAVDFKMKARDIIADSSVLLPDKIVMLYMNSWVNYAQMREFYQLRKRFSVTTVMPFDHPLAATQMLRAKNSYRRKGNWDKQAIRDVFQPYFDTETRRAKVGSLIVPYDNWFRGKESAVFAYLRTSPIVKKAIDIELLADSYDSLVEPGLFMLRLVNLAAWYDANWNKENLFNFEHLVKDLS